MLKADNIASTKQYYFLIFVVWALIVLLLVRYFQLQILNYDQYSKKANTNRIRKVTISAPRGLILDRNSEILVDNLPTYILNAIPGELSIKHKTFQFIANNIGIDSSIVSKNYKKYYRGRFIPTRLAKDLSFDQISRLEENKLNTKGVYYQQFPERAFPSIVNASHILGYVKEVDKEIRNSLNNPSQYEFGDIIGWSGLEKMYEKSLKGVHGIQFYQVDAFGREVGLIDDFPPKDPDPGFDIITTIDVRIQKILEDEMRGRRGVIIVGIPKTGEILGAVSMPDFEPDLFTGRISHRDWMRVLNHPDKPLVNRFNQGLYPPGSIVKMITEAVLLDNPEFDPKFSQLCEGTYQFGDRVFGCWSTEGHGEVNLSSAIIESCDVYFYKTIKFYDFDKLAGFFKRFGFGKNTGVDIPGESKGVVPTTKYMNDRYGRLGWSRGALLNYCIGQGEILVTPMQVFNYTNLLATEGESAIPHFVQSQETPINKSIKLSEEIWNHINNDMEQVVRGEKGTGKLANIINEEVRVFGKTGTAENPHGEDHAWFIGWIDIYGEKYSITVLVENGGSGGTVAAPIAKNIFSKLIGPKSFVKK